MSNNNNLNLNHHHHHHRNRIINNHHHHLHLLPNPSNSSTTTTTTTTRSTSSTARSTSTAQACAACRYQRRKCAPEGPYFPHDRQRQFQNAHKLFGVSNITKIIRDLDPPQKDEAMRTIIYQADVRAHDPVGGCYRIIRELQRQIEFSHAELEIVLHQLAFCRTHAQHQNHQILFDDDVNLYDQGGLDLDLGQQQQDHGGQWEQNLNDQAQLKETSSWANMNNNSPPPQVDDCVLIDDIPAGEPHEFKFEFDDINEPSEETVFNDGNHKALRKEENVVSYQQHNEDSDLKGAATLFTLTNCSSC